MKIVTDNKAIQRELASLGKCMQDNGTWIHPDITIAYTEETGLSIQMERTSNPRDFIIKVPVEQLVPYELLNMAVKGNDFVIDPDKDKLSPVQIDLAERMIEIYNLTNKVEFHKSENAWILFREAPELLDLLLEAFSWSPSIEYYSNFLHGLEDAASMDQFILDSFSSSRFLGQKIHGSEKTVQVIMPIIDFLNHDYRGSGFASPTNPEEKQWIGVTCAQPFISRNECYASYGTNDALNSFLIYGFIDATAPYVRSIPLEIPIGDLGKITVYSLNMKSKSSPSEQLQDLHQFMPKIKKDKDGAVHLSHLFVTVPPFPRALRRILRHVIVTFCGHSVSEDFILEQTRAAERLVVGKNVAFYKEILKKIDQNKTAPSGLIDRARHVATIQLSKLGNYQFDEPSIS